MKQTINFCDFQDAFTRMDRQEQFSYEGKKALFEYLENYEEETGEEMELNVIALCCDWSEINVEDIEQETGCESLEDLQDNTTVIEVNSQMIIYQAF